MKKDTHQEFVSDRIRQIGEAKKLTIKELGRSLNVPIPTLKSWKNSDAIKASILISATKAWNVSPRWLLLGEGDMFLPEMESHGSVGDSYVEYRSDKIDLRRYEDLMRKVIELEERLMEIENK